MTTVIGQRPDPVGAVLRRLDPTCPPHPWMLAPWEFPRAGAELAGSLALSPALVALHGVGGLRDRIGSHPSKVGTHPVLAVPGLWGDNSWTLPLRVYLNVLGHDVRRLDPATMRAGRDTVVRALIDQVERLADETGTSVSVVAWSIGGCFVRQAMARRPKPFRRLITLGTPIAGQLWYGREPAPRSLRAPVTAIYSRTDGIVNWRQCRVPKRAGAENVEIVSSHFGMSTNPQSLYVIGDRLRR